MILGPSLQESLGSRNANQLITHPQLRADGNEHTHNHSLYTQLDFSPYNSGPSPMGWCHPSGLDFPTSLHLIKTISHRHSQNPTNMFDILPWNSFQVILGCVKLSFKANYYSMSGRQDLISQIIYSSANSGILLVSFFFKTTNQHYKRDPSVFRVIGDWKVEVPM